MTNSRVFRPVAVLALGLGLGAGLGPSSARADECAASYVQAAIRTPKDGEPIARNVEFQLSEHTGCGDALPSEPPQYRLTGPAGPIDFTRLPSTRSSGVLRPDEPLPPGTVTIEARDPIGEHAWGDWRTLETLEVADRLDENAPTLKGIARARARVVTGLVMLSPCEAIDAPVVETTVRFRLADDGPEPHDSLIYALDRRADAQDDWELVTQFRPDRAGKNHGTISWEDEDDWDHTWSYRLRVMDASGHETIGADEITVRTPSRPPESTTQAASDSPPGSPRSPALQGPAPEDGPPLSPGWQWGAAFGTLFGAGLAGLKRRRRSRKSTR